MCCEIVLQGRLKGKKIVLQYSFCIAEKEAWRVGLCCNTLECIAIEEAGLGWEFVLQYKNCIATVEQGQGWTVLQYSGQPSHDTAGVWQEAGRAGGALGARQGAASARADARARVRAHGQQARGRQATARGACAAGARKARGLDAGPAAWALGARPGRTGWPWAVHSMHSAYFRSVLTRYCS